MKKEDGFIQAIRVLPQRLRQAAVSLPNAQREGIEEFRVRVGQPFTALLAQEERILEESPIAPGELEELLELASRSSVHAVLDQMRRGYLTLEGGHRVGLCGTAVMKEGEIHTLRRLSSASIRIAREFPGAALSVLEQITANERLKSTLILAPPGLGKTTLLRDLVRCVSSGMGTSPQRVGLADERGEVAAMWNGAPQLDVGPRTDVIEGCPKAQGLLLLLRAMNPQVLAADEITAPEDVQALIQACGCGAVLLATAHGLNREDLERRPLYQTLLAAGVFETLVTIRREDGVRRYQAQVLA